MPGKPHEHAYGPDDAQPCVEIDEHHCLARWWYDPERRLAFNHDEPGQDYRCAGSILLSPPSENGWTHSGSLEGGDLTLNPSVLCTGHNNHGFVRDGKWVPA